MMRCCVEIEPASLQGLKDGPSNKIGSRNHHHSMVLRAGLKKTRFGQPITSRKRSFFIASQSKYLTFLFFLLFSLLLQVVVG